MNLFPEPPPPPPVCVCERVSVCYTVAVDTNLDVARSPSLFLLLFPSSLVAALGTTGTRLSWIETCKDTTGPRPHIPPSEIFFQTSFPKHFASFLSVARSLARSAAPSIHPSIHRSFHRSMSPSSTGDSSRVRERERIDGRSGHSGRSRGRPGNQPQAKPSR